MGRDQRRLRNMFIAPIVQGKIIFHIAVVLTLSTAIMLFQVNGTWTMVLEVLFGLPDTTEAVRNSLVNELSSFFTILTAILIIQFLVISGLLVLHTHRFLGAAFAITRYVRDHLLTENFDGKLVLRENDYLTDLAQQVNALGEKLANDEMDYREKKDTAET